MDLVKKYDSVLMQIVGEGVTRRVLAYEEEMMMVEVGFKQGSVGAIHSHPHIQATFVLEGEFEFTLGEEKAIVKQNDTLTIPKDLLHGVLCIKQGRLLDVFTPMRKDFV